MGAVNTNNNIKVKQQQDSPFLTLSERTAKGINNVNNIFGDNQQVQDPKRTERTDSLGLSLFPAQEGQQAGEENIGIGQAPEKSGDDYFQQGENGEVAFDNTGFMDDALNVNFGNTAAKAGNAQGTKQLESELKLMLRDPENNKQQIADLKEQIEAAGGNADDIIAEGLEKAKAAHGGEKAGATNPIKANAKGAEKTGDGTNEGGASEIGAMLNTPNFATPNEGSSATNNTSTASGQIGSNTITDVNNMLGTDYAKKYETGELQFQKTVKDSGNGTSAAAGGNSEEPGIASQIGSGLKDQAISTGTGAIMEATGLNTAVKGTVSTLIGDPLKALGSTIGLCDNPYADGFTNSVKANFSSKGSKGVNNSKGTSDPQTSGSKPAGNESKVDVPDEFKDDTGVKYAQDEYKAAKDEYTKANEQSKGLDSDIAAKEKKVQELEKNEGFSEEYQKADKESSEAKAEMEKQDGIAKKAGDEKVKYNDKASEEQTKAGEQKNIAQACIKEENRLTGEISRLDGEISALDIEIKTLENENGKEINGVKIDNTAKISAKKSEMAKKKAERDNDNRQLQEEQNKQREAERSEKEFTEMSQKSKEAAGEQDKIAADANKQKEIAKQKYDAAEAKKKSEKGDKKESQELQAAQNDLQNARSKKADFDATAQTAQGKMNVAETKIQTAVDAAKAKKRK